MIARRIGALLVAAFAVSVVNGQTIERLTVSPATVYGGESSTGEISLSKKAGSGGVTVTLKSTAAAAIVPATVTVVQGATTASFTITTSPVSIPVEPLITCSRGSKSVDARFAILAPRLKSIVFDPGEVIGGNSATGLVTIGSLAPPEGFSVRLTSHSPELQVPPTVKIAPGSSSAAFVATTSGVEVETVEFVIGTASQVVIDAHVRIKPAELTSLTLSSPTIAGGDSLTGTVGLNGKAPPKGVKITLSCPQSDVTVPREVTILAGAHDTTFAVATKPVITPLSTKITAEVGKSSIGVPLTVNPPKLSTLSVSPTSVTGGTSSTGTVTLNGPAPSGGFEITLQSNQSFADVPASASVPAGSKTATFSIATTTVSSTMAAVITATDPSSATATAKLTVVPPGGLAGSGWAKFRGNTKNTGLGTGTGADGTTKWVTQTNNQTSWSSPAIGPDGTIFVGSDDGNLYAISPTGAVKWTYLTGARVMGSPAIDSNGIVYVGSDDFVFYAINPNGTLKWKYQGGQTFESNPTIAADGTIYCGCFDNNLYAFSPSGALKWSLNTGGGVFGSPAIGSDGTIYVGVLNVGLIAVNPSGTQKWVFGGDGGFFETPCVGSDGTVYVTSDYGHLYAVKPNGSQRWASTAISEAGELQVSSPGIGPDGTIYVGSFDGNVCAINPDGTTKWKYLTGGYVQSCPAVGPDGIVYISSNDGKIYAFKPDGTVKWTSPYGGLSMSPALAPNGTVYVSAPGSGLCAIGKA